MPVTLEAIKSNANNTKPEGKCVDFLGETFYKIERYTNMPPFFMTIVSSSDVWNYIWSTGALSAGRKNAEYAVFPYYTADKIADMNTVTGSKTLLQVTIDKNNTYLWQPFNSEHFSEYGITHSLYKNISGSKLYFEETNHDLGLSFFYGWTSSAQFGLVRHAFLKPLENAKTPSKIVILDGCKNLLPAGTNTDLQNNSSSLVDAYKKSELVKNTDIALFSLSSVVTDKAEPYEALRVNTAWLTEVSGLKNKKIILQEQATELFKQDKPIEPVTHLNGFRASFFVYAECESSAEWYMCFDTALDHNALETLKATTQKTNAVTELETDIRKGCEQLEHYVGLTDGITHTADQLASIHHFANVLFNDMRGGIFAYGYTFELSDFIAFCRERNTHLTSEIIKACANLAQKITVLDIKKSIEYYVKNTGNMQVLRLFLEYLPLTFSRRHGDPSRPWNKFSIDIQDEYGNPKLAYQGNWRDIFQNWESLCISYPIYFEQVTAKFLNAATLDGFNPYRLSREGIDWEVIEPNNPWSHIGYWGDHQIIYLCKLLEWQYAFFPQSLTANLDKAMFSAANVPYRIRSYNNIVKNPHETITFDYELHTRIIEKVAEFGSDAKLVCKKNEPILFTFTEKVLHLLLAKAANYVPNGGIWLNTQRPEWNDANNALAGYGLSMVTLYYIRRFIVFLMKLYQNGQTYAITQTTAIFFERIVAVYASHTPESLDEPLKRRAFVDANGALYEAYRNEQYKEHIQTDCVCVPAKTIIAGLQTFLHHFEHAIKTNQRQDGLFHSYNTLSILDNGGMSVSTLYEMLEGQVAVLSSGYLTESAAVDLLKTMRKSALYRKDQHSYLLYPEKTLDDFERKNTFSDSEVTVIPALKNMIEKDSSIIARDIQGKYHFNARFYNARILSDFLHQKKFGEQDIKDITTLYEKVFNHREFTGRSGTFYAYEGIGSIYWHMVSKLLLAVQENYAAAPSGAHKTELARIYYDVRSGIGFNKTPDAYGAFPFDPYSHTPPKQGAKQPGMTGQVKEEIITRFGEFGLYIKNGIITIEPSLLQNKEFFTESTDFCYFSHDGKKEIVSIPPNSLAFTYCSVPFVYTQNTQNTKQLRIKLLLESAGKIKEIELPNQHIPQEFSTEIFYRNGIVKKVEVTL